MADLYVRAVFAVGVLFTSSHGVPGSEITKFDAERLHDYGPRGATSKQINVSDEIWALVNKHHDPFAEQDIEAAFQKAIKDETLMARSRAALRVTFTALPKDADGRLTAQTARYALHRHFLHRSGWFLRGLQPTDAETAHIRNSTREWIPGYIEGLIAQRAGKDFSERFALDDLAAFAVTIELLVDQETEGRIRDIFTLLRLPMTGPISADFGRCVLLSHVSLVAKTDMTDADRGNTALSYKQLQNGCSVREKSYALKYLSQRPDLMAFVKPFIEAVVDSVDFSSIVRIAQSVERKVHEYTDGQCDRLRSVLRSLEVNGEAGYVPLIKYYEQKGFSHWEFVETPDFLSFEGAYDNTTYASPRVVVANYVESRSNCNEVSNMYAACCRSECDEVLQELELHFERPFGTPTEIVELLSQTSLAAAGLVHQSLDASVLESLHEIARARRGRVPLHSHIFEHWLHRAFPRKCPRPAAGRTVNMMTPSEWMEVEDASNSDVEADMSETDDMAHATNVVKLAIGVTCLVVAGNGFLLRRIVRRSVAAGHGFSICVDLIGIVIFGAGLLGVANSMGSAMAQIMVTAAFSVQMLRALANAFFMFTGRSAKCI